MSETPAEQFLFPYQVDALRQLKGACDNLDTELVVIGALAYRVLVGNHRRSTEDVDVAVDLDLDELRRLAEILESQGWEWRYHFRGSSWMAQALKASRVEIRTVELAPEVVAALREAQRRQFR